ncbi:interleukin-1 receptor-like 1 isoform X1 [Cavia porcellus]|uniref:interleukin-1 receptor-like 1 isoform X1 n=1 Tax=Cavia porcellus TaxID=10141 RepID=UPI000661CD59
MSDLRLLSTDALSRGLWCLVILTMPIYFTAAKVSSSSPSLENEALIVNCPVGRSSLLPREWYYPKTNRSIPTQSSNRVFASEGRLKFLPAKVEDSGVYTCVIRSPSRNMTGYVNVTIYKRPTDCHVPDDVKYATVTVSEKNPRIYCPNMYPYNWTAPFQWFKNCKALQGPRYTVHRSHLFIHNLGPDDEGDYTCRFTHNENGVHYNVTATMSLVVKDRPGTSMFPVITAPSQNETKEVEMGEAVNITCVACFGTRPQFFMFLLWQVNGTNVNDMGVARFQEEQGEIQSNNMPCLRAVLKITEVKEEDLSLEYSCLALNLDGLRQRAVRLIKKKPNGKLYDAYVVYPRDYTGGSEGPSSMEYFVHEMLPSVLENKCGYSLCIYGRDLLPGEDVATAVESSIRKSRRHLFVLTPHTSHSKEFAYKQEVALHCALIQGDSKVILIEMEAEAEPRGLQAAGLQDALSHLMRAQGTIKWREDLVANKQSLNSKFWKHVRYQMPTPSRPPQRGSR